MSLFKIVSSASKKNQHLGSFKYGNDFRQIKKHIEKNKENLSPSLKGQCNNKNDSSSEKLINLYGY